MGTSFRDSRQRRGAGGPAAGLSCQRRARTQRTPPRGHPSPRCATSHGAERAQTGQTAPVHYMVVETYTNGPEPIYRRAAERGRMLPAGLRYLESWVVDDDALDRCFQLMETDDRRSSTCGPPPGATSPRA